MEKKPRCKKCGRILTSALSIAMGMGPKCAGISLTKGHSIPVGNHRSSGTGYSASGLASVQTAFIPTELPEKKVSKRELGSRKREERRSLFEKRQQFQCGFLVRGKMPLIYEPVGEKEWKNSLSGNIISHDRLLDYLIRYNFLNQSS